MKCIWGIAGVVFSLSTVDARAQSATPPLESSEPSVSLLEDARSSSSIPAIPMEGEGVDGREMRAYIVREDAIPYQDEGATIRHSEITVSFGQNFKVIARPSSPSLVNSREARRELSFDDILTVADGNDRTFYLRGSDIVLDPFAYRSREYNGTKNPSYLKVVISNHFTKLKEGGEGFNSIDLSYGPGPLKSDEAAGFSKAKTATVFNIHYLYKTSCFPDSTSCQQGDPNEYLLLGKRPQLDFDDPTSGLVGWVPSTAVYDWPNQLGVYFNSDEAAFQARQSGPHPVVVYQDEATADKAYREPASIQEELIVMRETLGDAPRQLPKDRMRFAILDEPRSNARHLKVAFIGDTFDLAALRGDPQACQTDAALQSEIGRSIADDARLRDVVFLIDATKSMKAFFEPVKRAIQRFIKQRQGSTAQNWRFAVAVYRDRADGPRSFEIVTPLTTNIQIIDRALGRLETFSRDTDLPESLFAGIRGVLDGRDEKGSDLQWDSRRVRALIVIGDHPDHADNNDFNEVERRLREPILGPISIYALNVDARREGRLYETFNKEFLRQMRRVQNLAQAGEVVALAQGTTTGQAETAVFRSLESFQLFAGQFTGAVEDLNEGATAEEVSRDWGTEAGLAAAMYVRQRWKAAGVDCVRLKDLRQIVSEGWVSKQISREQRIDQLQTDVLVSRRDLNGLYSIYSQIDDELALGGSEGVGEAIVRAVERATGDRWGTDEELGEFLRRQIYVPFNKELEFLKKTPSEFENYVIGSDENRRAVRGLFDKSRLLLEGVRRGRRIGRHDWFRQIEKDEIGAWDFKESVKRDKDWFFKAEDGVFYAWVPIEFFPWSSSSP